METITNPILPGLASKGLIGVGIPAGKGGSGGDFADVFDAVAEVARSSIATASILAVQRHFAEVLLASENIGVAEYRLGYVLDGSISGACTATWPDQAFAPLAARETDMAWRLTGALHPVPNVGKAWYLVTARLQLDARRPPCLAILRSEQDGMSRQAVVAGAAQGDDTAGLCARNVFFLPDEILQEDETQIHEHLTRFAVFLRCAIDAGRAWRAAVSLDADVASDAQATVARTVDTLVRSTRQSRHLPSADELRTASRSLRLLHAAVAP